MPPAAYKGGPELEIQLDSIGRSHQQFQPGSVITGRVIRRSPGVSPRAAVSIQLLGRAKTKITVSRNNGQTSSKSHYRNRFNFFEPTQTRQFLFDGPLHIAPDASAVEPASWSFAVSVPVYPSPRALMSGGGDAEACFLSLRPEDICSQPLPASFITEGRQFNVRFQAYVEYQLEALLITTGKQGKDVTAVLPIQLCAPSTQHPLSNFEIHRRSMLGLVSTYHLVPGMEKAELSFKQKTKQLLGSSKVPSFGYAVHVDCPAVIQLENPTPIPFSMRIQPDGRPGRTSDIIQDVDQTVALTSLEIVLKAHTAVIAPTTFHTQKANDSVKHIIPLPVTALGRIINPSTETDTPTDKRADDQSHASTMEPFGLIIPSKWRASDETALNIGGLMDFQLFSTHATALSRSLGRTTTNDRITPDFETYCIRHSHTIKWKIALEIAGKTSKHESEQIVTIIGPSEPPPPPSPPVTAANQQMGDNFEELPSYSVNDDHGGPSNSDRAFAPGSSAHAGEVPMNKKE